MLTSVPRGGRISIACAGHFGTKPIAAMNRAARSEHLDEAVMASSVPQRLCPIGMSPRIGTGVRTAELFVRVTGREET
jgi:hypothetical protein